MALPSVLLQVKKYVLYWRFQFKQQQKKPTHTSHGDHGACSSFWTNEGNKMHM